MQCCRTARCFPAHCIAVATEFDVAGVFDNPTYLDFETYNTMSILFELVNLDHDCYVVEQVGVAV